MPVRLALLLSFLVACAAERPPPPHAVPTTPSPPSPVARGRLIVRHQRIGLAVCAREAECAAIPALPEKVASVTQSGPGRYIVTNATSSFEYTVATGTVDELDGAGPEVIARLEDRSLIRYEHLATHSRVLRRAPGENWAVVLAYENLRAYEFRFLPDGRHLFKSSPGMGGPESPYFTDLIVNHPTHLHIVDALGKKPRRVHSSSQQMDADFLDGGRRVAWWQPGSVDEKTNERTIALQVLELATNKVSTIDTVVTPIGRRDAPETSSSLRSTWIVHSDHVLRADDVASGNRKEYQLGPDERLFEAIPHDSTWPHRHARRWSDHVVVATRLGDVTELAVMSVPSFAVVYRTKVPTFGLMGADWVETL